MEKTGLNYIDLVYKVLENWYVLCRTYPKLIVGILVFTFFLSQVNTEPLP
jgi:small conductance mechanosensitive channel